MNDNESRFNDLTEAVLFDLWYRELMQSHPWPNCVASMNDWRDYYEDGYTTKEAIEEDMSYGM